MQRHPRCPLMISVTEITIRSLSRSLVMLLLDDSMWFAIDHPLSILAVLAYRCLDVPALLQPIWLMSYIRLPIYPVDVVFTQHRHQPFQFLRLAPSPPPYCWWSCFSGSRITDMELSSAGTSCRQEQYYRLRVIPYSEILAHVTYNRLLLPLRQL